MTHQHDSAAMKRGAHMRSAPFPFYDFLIESTILNFAYYQLTITSVLPITPNPAREVGMV